MTNILEAAEMIELHYAFLGIRRCDGGSADAALARYGADLLGRAIGHELNWADTTQAPTRSAALRTFYNQLVAELIPHPTRRIMAMYAIADVLAGR
jgi:hypothetical protein